MSRPLYSVGEEVHLVSKSLPELNGDDVVEEVFTCRDDHIKWLNENYPFDGLIWREGKNVIYPNYILSKRYERENKKGFVTAITWRESALRKKHKPYEGEVFDFSEEDSPYKIGETA